MHGQALQVAHLQQALDHLLALLRDIVHNVLEVPAPDLLEQLGLVLGAEGVVALQQDVEEDAERPHVGVDGTVVQFGDYFGGHVGGRAAEGVDGLVLLAAETEAEVDEFELPVAVDEDVFGLDVAVGDVEVVQVLEGLCDDQEELLGLGLGQAMLGLGEQVVVEGIGAAVLEDEVELCLRFDDVEQLGDGGVGQLSEDVDLPLQILDLVGLVQPLLLVDLYGDLLVGALVHPHLHDPVRSFPQLPVDLVVVLLFLGLYGHDEVEQLGLARLFLLVGVLDLHHLEFLDVVGGELVLHEVAHEVDVHLLGLLVLLLQRLLSALGVGGRAVCHLSNDLAGS